jgi:hypothetical protein
MAYASRSGRARTSVSNPRAFAVCQRCGLWYNRIDLKFQFDWRGAQLQNLYILVCTPCYDEPQSQRRAITLPADPVPVYYPSVEDFVADESDYRTIGAPAIDPRTGLPIPSEVYRVTADCQNRTLQPYGQPVGMDANAIMPTWTGVGTIHLGAVLPALSVSANGTAVVTVTCSAPHNLQPPFQIAARGLTAANGFYTANVTTATAFTYDTQNPIPLGATVIATDSGFEITTDTGAPIATSQTISPQSLLTSTTLIQSCQIGLPYGYATIPPPNEFVPGSESGGG